MTQHEFMMSIGEKEDILKLMNEDEKSFLTSYVAKMKKEQAMFDERLKKEKARFEEKQLKRRRSLLGLEYGEWVRNIPRKERFVIAVRDSEHFIGWSGDEKNDPSKWVSVESCCAIDILRGYMSPYWGYYGDTEYTSVSRQVELFYKERVSKIENAKNEDRLVTVIDCNWNFFYINNDYKDTKFAILDYEIDENGNVKILGRSDYKTFSEHQKDLIGKYENTPTGEAK